MRLESEFEIFDNAYILKDSKIIKTNIRYIKFPDASRFDETPTNSQIQYGCCTEQRIDGLSGLQETEDWYDWRFANEIGKTKNELLDKLRD